jgi:hypothetical protein
VNRGGYSSAAGSAQNVIGPANDRWLVIGNSGRASPRQTDGSLDNCDSGSYPQTNAARARECPCSGRIEGASLRYCLWVLKKPRSEGLSAAINAVTLAFPSLQLRGGFHSRCNRLTEEAHQSLDVLSHRCEEELLAHEPESPQTQAPQSDLILQFCKQGLHLFPLPLCFGELWRVDQLPRPLSGWFVSVDDKAAEGSTGALWSERAWATLFSCPDVVVSAVPMNPAAIVQLLPRWTAIAVAFGLIREPLGTEERAVLSMNAVTGPHIRRDAAIRQPLQELSVPVGRVG